MKQHSKDIIVTKEIIDLFKNSVRIVDKKHLAGIWPVDINQLGRLKDLLQEKNILQKYDIAVAYRGRSRSLKKDFTKSIKNDFVKYGFKLDEKLIEHNIFIQGIPVPWQLLRKVGIDYKKVSIVLTQK